MTGVLLSFHLFTLFRKGISMETNRTTSRRTLALIQIWASEQIALLSSVAGSLSHGSRPYPGDVELPRLRERRAFWQVTAMIAQAFLSVTVRTYSCLTEYRKREPVHFYRFRLRRGRFIPAWKAGTFPPVLCKR